jgi:hypothetical protein
MALLKGWGGKDVEVEQSCLRTMSQLKSSGSRIVSR